MKQFAHLLGAREVIFYKHTIANIGQVCVKHMDITPGIISSYPQLKMD